MKRILYVPLDERPCNELFPQMELSVQTVSYTHLDVYKRQGDTRPVLMKFAVSNDFLHMGEYVLPAGGVVTRHSEVLCHESESFLLGMEGPMTVYMTDTRETYQLKHYEGLYLSLIHI